MDDLISREKAIEALLKEFERDTPKAIRAKLTLENLPSAQPEKRTEERTETHACDLISRQAAIEALKEAFNPSIVNFVKAKIAIENLPSAQPENDWIPVTKKAHPDLPIRVQVQLDNGWIITAYYQEGEWLSVPDCGAPLKDEYVEAWCELPEPYAERRTDEQDSE